MREISVPFITRTDIFLLVQYMNKVYYALFNIHLSEGDERSSYSHAPTYDPKFIILQDPDTKGIKVKYKTFFFW